MLLTLFSSFGSRDKFKLIILSLIVVISSFLEVISIGLIIPFLAILTGQSSEIFNFISSNSNGLQEEQTDAVKITYIFVTSIIVSNLFRVFSNYYQIYAIKDIGLNFSSRIIANMLRSNNSILSEDTVAQKVTSATSKITILIGNGIKPIITLLSNTISSIIIFTYLMYLEPKMTILVTASLLFFYFLASILTRQSAQNASKQMDLAQVAVTRKLKDMFTGQKEIQAYQSHGWFEEKFIHEENNFRSSLAAVHVLSQLPRYLIETILISVLAIYILFTFSTLENDTQAFVGRLGAFIFGMQRLAPLAQGIYAAFATFKGSKHTLEDLVQQLNQKEEFRIEYARGEHTEICMTDVSCGHWTQGNKILLRDINCTLQSSHVYELAGPSGSGKSTIINLIMGRLEPSNGHIVGYFPSDPKIGYAPQDITILDATVKENLMFGRDEDTFDDQQMWDTLKSVRLLEKVEQLGGLNASVGEMGRNLSGGERQRLAIARTILVPPNILILDETTSGIDQDTEAKILEKLKKIMNQGIIVIVSHRSLPSGFVDTKLKIENGALLTEYCQRVK
jgi:ATP-binding cassette, subfamily B, bacterial PglK